MRITAFQSDDGVLDALLRPSGKWVLRFVSGPAWFYCPLTARWEPASRPDFNLASHEMDMSAALALLDSVQCPPRNPRTFATGESP
jgi:hypothetical protein